MKGGKDGPLGKLAEDLLVGLVVAVVALVPIAAIAVLVRVIAWAVLWI